MAINGNRLAVLAAAVSGSPELAALADADGSVIWVNPAYTAYWSCVAATSVTSLLEIVQPDCRCDALREWDAVQRGDTSVASAPVRLRSGSISRAGRIRLTRVPLENGTEGVVVHVDNIEDVAAFEPGIDRLTELPGRTQLLETLDRHLVTPPDAELIVVDLDHFGLVNDSFGHAAGDDVLTTMATRLRRTAHPEDVVARITGDEFAVLCTHAHDQRRRLTEELQAAVRAPIRISETDHAFTASLGIVSLDLTPTGIEAVAAAGIAVRVAKARGRDRAEVFDSGQRDSALQAVRRMSELYRAARNDELVLRYQPIVDLQSGTTVGCEALMRWNHPEEGELAAGEFIHLAESSGLINDLTSHLLTSACLAAARIAGAVDEDAPYISVNLSPTQLADRDLLDIFDRAVAGSGITPGQLMVEITETAMFVDLAAAIETLTSLRSRGVRVALDDFGTGYSSLLRLRELPVDCLKVDRAFVSGLTHNADDLAIVASVIHMAVTLGLTCIAEGVETTEHVDELRRLGCSAGQGFLWCPAVPIDQVPRNPGVRPASIRVRRQEQAPAADGATTAWIMRLHQTGASLNSIAAALNQAGSRTNHRTRWNARTVARVVAEAAYPRLRT